MKKNKKIFSIIFSAVFISQFALSGFNPQIAKAEQVKAISGSALNPLQGTNSLTTGEALKLKEETEIKVLDLTDKGTNPPTPSTVTPSAYQLQYQKEELAAFCHFGMNTYTDVEWGNGKETPDQFKLTKDFDAETVVKTLQEAGFKRLIVTAKHHDGFCIWNSQYTDHDIASTSYKNGQGDVLAEISAACTKYNMDMGLYLSPWDENADSYGYYDADGNALCDEKGNPKDGMTWEEVYKKDAKDYNEYYKNQIEEIASNPKYGNNGKFVEWWMDGAKGGGADAQNYDFESWFETIQKYEGKVGGNIDDCLLFGAEAKTTVRWIGNESGFANEETWSLSKVDETKNTIDSNTQGGYTIGYPDGNKWTVPECDARITPGWFWHKNQSPKSMEALAEMYFKSVGHGGTLLLNVPPNQDGTLDEAILNRVKEFGKGIKDTFQINLASGAIVSGSSVRGNDIAFSPQNVLDNNFDTYWTTDDGVSTGSLTIDLGETKMFDVVSIEEYIPFGQRISKFSVEYQNESGEWKEFAKGTTIGAKRLCRSNAVKGNKIRINIEECYQNAVPLISEAGVYKAIPDFSVQNNIPEDLDYIDNTEFTISDGWNPEEGDPYTNGTNMWTNAGEEASFNFTGTTAWLVGTKDPGHGKMKIFIDGQEIETVDTQNSSRGTKQLIYQTPLLKDGIHNLKIVTIGTIGLEGAYYLNNHGAGMFEIEKNRYSVVEGSDLKIKIKRVGGSIGKATVLVNDNPGSAVSGQYYEPFSEVLVFEEGETEKEITLHTIDNNTKTGDLNFYLEMYTPTNAILGFNSLATIIFLDDESMDLAKLKEDLTALLETANKKNPDYFISTSFEILLQAKNHALEVSNNLNATVTQLYYAIEGLEEAINQLVSRAPYSQEDPFYLPENLNDIKSVEAEFFILDSTNAEPGKEVRIGSSDTSSNGKHISWFEQGNVIKLPYQAKKAGKYKFTVYYISGRSDKNPNHLNWSGTNISSGSLLDFTGDGQTWNSKTFEVSITKKGAGEIIFTADKNASPNIDKFDVVLVEEIKENEDDTSLLPSSPSSSEAPFSTATPKPDDNQETNDNPKASDTPKPEKKEESLVVDNKGNSITSKITTKNKNNVLKINVKIKQKDILNLIEQSESKVKLSILVPKKQIKEFIFKKDVKKIVLGFNIPNIVLKNKKANISEIIVEKQTLNQIKKANKKFVVNVKNEENVLQYVWEFSPNDLKKNKKVQTLNLAVNKKKASSVEKVKAVLKNDKNNKDGIVLDLKEINKVSASLKVKIGEDTDFNTVYVYCYNKNKKKLELLDTDSKVKVNKQGYIKFKIKQNSDYVILTKKADKKIVVNKK